MTEPNPPTEPDEPLSEVDDWDPGETDPDDTDPDETTDRTGGIGSVRGDHNVTISGSRGAVTIMEQVAFHLRTADADNTAWSPRLVPEDTLSALARRFVGPPAYGDLVARLRKPGTVVVSDAPGYGRRAAALMVLRDSGEGATRFRELPDDDTDDRFVLDPNVIEPGERLLLDLSIWTAPIPRKVIDGIRGYRAAVAQREAYLAIILPLEQQHVAAEIGTEAVLIGRPDGATVFSRHLSAHGIDVAVDEMRDETLRGHLNHDPMRDIAALADRVRQARGEAKGHGVWKDWLAAAFTTETYVDTVAQYVREHPDGRSRALLLAAAMFEHSSPEAVATAAATFLEIVKYPPPEGHRLDLPDLAEALGELHATIDNRQVRFSSLAYAEAVRTHFWRTFPDLRIKLRQWLDRAVLSNTVTAAGRSKALLRYIDQCLRTGHPNDLSTLVEQWADRGPSTSDKWVDAAGTALTRGLLDEQYGRWFRRRVYGWALNHRLRQNFATLLVGLCENVIAPAQPDQALVRLRHLARHTDTAVVIEARAALSRLCRDGRFARRMLTRVHGNLTGDRPQGVDYVLFTDVADPVRLTGAGGYPRIVEPVVRTMLVDGWSAWLATRQSSEAADAVVRWLEAHAEQPDRNALLEVLAAATRGTFARRAVLYGISRDWVAIAAPEQRDARRRTAALLQQACADVRTNTAQTSEPRPAQGVSH